ncbi:hypothetical protein N7539_007227 [Penicillium diatomitis]|uniref:Lanthionine synthetase C family protein n=1 Tax=Penicillium diatomitis TaxID=2819901 RepID=A0A9X0BNT6_9EURO|nr:uncharacterized protein N7539_007227 [Penicillium diatomitis]KAJ5477083.1 hypothetical protein N7539_007227 [Penicillium diatomitis]
MIISQRPRFYENKLVPVEINPVSLIDSLRQLRMAVHNGADKLNANEPLHDKWNHGGMFLTFSGISLAFLRLDYQNPVLSSGNATASSFLKDALARIPCGLPDVPLIPSRLSPAGSFSPLAAVTLRILAEVAKSGWGAGERPSIAPELIKCLEDAVNLALENPWILPHGEHRMGGDEILYGRAGLLWLLLNVRAHQYDESTTKLLSPVLAKLPNLIGVIIDAGREGSKHYRQEHSDEDAHPLMYAWMEGHYGFGAAHGATGILSVLLSCATEEISEYISEIGETITALCKFCVAHSGHLPKALPPRDSNEPSELVQFCHGSPAILLLLGVAFNNEQLTQGYWHPAWDQALYQATCRVWEEGLLSKGGSLCHGVSGNAWPWLLLHDAFEYKADVINGARSRFFQNSAGLESLDESLPSRLTPDFFLSRALAFMLHSFETRPYRDDQVPSEYDYCMPDEPNSLFNGLAGNLVAWAETCAVVQARLRRMMLSEDRGSLKNDHAFQEALRCRLGFPMIGGNGARGAL